MTQTQSNPDTPPNAPRFGPVDESDRIAAFRGLALADASMSDRAVRHKIEHTIESGVSLRYLWGSRDSNGRLDDVCWIIPQAGRTAMVLLSRPTGRRGVCRMAELIDATCDTVSTSDAVLMQALVTPSHDLHIAALREAGFDDLATLNYMQATVPHKARDPKPPLGVRLVPYSAETHDAFLAALDASYIETHDCPGLRGLRTHEHVLAGHKAAGRFEPELWTLLLDYGEPAGLCLINPIPDALCCELVYLGVADGFRRRGHGALLLRHAEALCAQHGYGVMTLAVDANNAPAVELYTRHRFHPTGTKKALIRRNVRQP